MNSYAASVAPMTFLFADLAGFTALTEAHGDENAAEMATGFCKRMKRLAPDGDGEVIKTIGDAVLIRCDSAAAAVKLGISIVESEGARTDFLALRIGMNSGSAVETEGDWFGSTVNVAARVAAVAGAGEVVLTEATLESAGDVEGIEFARLGYRNLRNVSEPVALLRATREGVQAGDLIIDPVCRMTIADEKWVGSLTFEGTLFRFCSMGCAQKFAAEPRTYADITLGRPAES